MSSIRPMRAIDLLDFDTCNLDPLTETYNIGFYLEYLAKWPNLCWVIVSQKESIEAYILGKVEASPNGRPSQEPYSPDTNKNMNYLPWHAHITALTVAPNCRRRGHANKLSTLLEEEGEKQNAWFVDLFVRSDNVNAIALYKKMGYSVFRRVKDYYSDGQDALDMRKALSRDKKRQTIRENGDTFIVQPHDVWDSGGDVTAKSRVKDPERTITLARLQRQSNLSSNENAEEGIPTSDRLERTPQTDPYPADWVRTEPPSTWDKPPSESPEPQMKRYDMKDPIVLGLSAVFANTPIYQFLPIPLNLRCIADHLTDIYINNIIQHCKIVHESIKFLTGSIVYLRQQNQPALDVELERVQILCHYIFLLQQTCFIGQTHSTPAVASDMAKIGREGEALLIEIANAQGGRMVTDGAEASRKITERHMELIILNAERGRFSTSPGEGQPKEER